MIRLRMALFAGAVALTIPMLQAQTLAEKELRTKQLAYMADDLKDVNKACGTNLTEDVDWESWKAGADDLAKHSGSINGRCNAVTTALAQLCRESADAKEAVSKGIQKLSCSYSGAGKQLIELKGGNLHYGVDLGAVNTGDAIKKYLKDHL